MDLKSLKVKTNHFSSMQGTNSIQRSNGMDYTIRTHRDRFFFPDEWMVFEDKLKKKQVITFKMLINTGARINEIRNVKVSDIDFERSGIVLRVTKRIVNRPGKDKVGKRKIRVVTISTQFTKYLKRIIKEYDLKDDDYLPVLSTPGANIAMKKALEKAGIVDWKMFSVHNVRKTLETWLVSLGADSFKVTKHFGHSIAIALKHYVSPDIFNWEDRKMMREIIGDLYQNSSQRL